MKCPCKGCDFRDAECHANCRLYSKWKKEQESIKKKRTLDAVLHAYFKQPERWQDHCFM